MAGMNLEWGVLAALSLLLLPLLIRLWRGPTPGDRILALEVIGGIGTLLLVLISTIAGRTIYLDLGVLLALFSFLGTLVIARYMERGLIAS